MSIISRDADERIARTIDAVRGKAAALEPRRNDLLEVERTIVDRALGTYLDDLVGEYRRMPDRWLDGEMSGGGTPRLVMLETVATMLALLDTADERLTRLAATRIAACRDDMLDGARRLAERSDTPLAVVDPRDPSPWPRRLTLALGAVLLAGAVVWLLVGISALGQAGIYAVGILSVLGLAGWLLER